MGQGEALHPPIPADGPPILPQDWPRQWKARLKRSPADLSLVTGLFSCLLRYCGAGRGLCSDPGGCSRLPVPPLTPIPLLPASPSTPLPSSCASCSARCTRGCTRL